MTLKRTVSTLAIALMILVASGCRDPLATEDGFTPDAGNFDAAPEDDAGPGEYCPPGSPDLFNNAMNPHFGGEASVDLEVVNYSYFRCPHCADFALALRDMWEARSDFNDRVRVYFHHYPFDNETAWRVHAATVAAGNQGMDCFWEMHDLLYDGFYLEPSIYYSPEELIAYAEDPMGLDMDQFIADMDSEYTLAYLQWDKAQAQAVGVTGTPSVYICGEKISRSQIEEIIDGYLGN